jgi:Restriction endonuclease
MRRHDGQSDVLGACSTRRENAMAKITRTFCPIHFEDLDPHRFEDLIRELIYDFREWQSIEATGRSGNDGGIDIRAYEKTQTPSTEVEEGEEITVRHPMEGNLWVIQGKREKEIGSKKLEGYLQDIDDKSPPYGYILAASANFSKDSYDLFRTTLREKGVMEFYLWGKPELEDMLHLPRNDRILFTFFGFSLVSRRKSRSAELRSTVANKNKIYRIFGDDVSFKTVLLRDANDDKYPDSDEYSDFKERPRWKEYPAVRHHPLGLIVNVVEYFAYVDPKKKEFDFSKQVSVTRRQGDSDEDRRAHQEIEARVEDFWEHLARRNQAMLCCDGLVRYDEMLVIDEKGDDVHKFPHIFVGVRGIKRTFRWFSQIPKNTKLAL